MDLNQHDYLVVPVAVVMDIHSEGGPFLVSPAAAGYPHPWEEHVLNKGHGRQG